MDCDFTLLFYEDLVFLFAAMFIGWVARWLWE